MYYSFIRSGRSRAFGRILITAFKGKSRIATDLHALLRKARRHASQQNTPQKVTPLVGDFISVRSRTRYPNEKLAAYDTGCCSTRVFEMVAEKRPRTLARAGESSGRIPEALCAHNGSDVLPQHLKEIEKSGPLPHVPVVVLASTNPISPSNRYPRCLSFSERRLVHQKVTRSKNESHRGWGHELPSLAPDDVTAAILSVVGTEPRH